LISGIHGARCLAFFNHMEVAAKEFDSISVRRRATSLAAHAIAKRHDQVSPLPELFAGTLAHAVVDASDSVDYPTRQANASPLWKTYRDAAISTCKRLFGEAPRTEVSYVGGTLDQTFSVRLFVPPLPEIRTGPFSTEHAALEDAYQRLFRTLGQRDLLITPPHSRILGKPAVPSSPQPPTSAPSSASLPPAVTCPINLAIAKNALQWACDKNGLGSAKYISAQVYEGKFEATVEIRTREGEPVAFVGHKMGKRVAAEQSAALRACEALWAQGAMIGVPKHFLAPDAPDAGGRGMEVIADAPHKAKSVLFHWYNINGHGAPKFVCKQDSESGPFAVSLKLPGIGREFSSSSCRRKADAERDVSIKACDWLIANTPFRIPDGIAKTS
jgi:hypothetical protein